MWGPGTTLDQWEKMEKTLRTFARRTLRVRKSTAIDLLLAELGLYPVQIMGMIAIARYIARVQDLSPDIPRLPGIPIKGDSKEILDRLPQVALQITTTTKRKRAKTWFGQ